MPHVWKQAPRRQKPKFKAGDTVRIAKEQGTFAKGHETNWSKDLFMVDHEYGSYSLSYMLRDLNGSVLEGRFYEHEL